MDPQDRSLATARRARAVMAGQSPAPISAAGASHEPPTLTTLGSASQSVKLSSPTPPVGQTMPSLPANAFTAQGLGGQVVLVDPTSETVVVRIGQFQASPQDAYTGNDAARFITEALVQP